MDFLIELLLEFLLQAFVEIFVELGLHSMAEPFRRNPSPVAAAFGYLLLGSLAGGLSLMAFPTHALRPGPVRVINLVLTPIAVGALMWAIGRWREHRHRPVLRIDRFFYGFLFAFAFALMRHHFAD